MRAGEIPLLHAATQIGVRLATGLAGISADGLMMPYGT